MPVDGVDDEGQTAMQAAAGQAHSHDRAQARVIVLLLKHGARVDPVNKNNQTPLFLAYANKNTATAAMLRSRGAR